MHIAQRMGAFGLLLVALAGAAGAQAPHPAGLYRLTGEQDVASELLIKPDGHFSYGLIAGALDEQAEGRWRREGNSIFLTTEPRPVPALFSRGEAKRSETAPLTLRVTWPGGRGVAGVDLRVGFAAGDPVDDYTQEDGWAMSAEEHRTPSWVQFAMPMFDLTSPRFPIDAAAANALTFVLTPNDLGTFDFQDMPADLAPGRLVLHRGEARLVYLRVRK
jgi:hypothetical protein